MLFQNSAFVSCIFLDPRYQKLLSKEDKLRAKQHLVKTWMKIQGLKEAGPNENENSTGSMKNEKDDDGDSDLDMYLAEKETDAVNYDNQKINTVDIVSILDTFEQTKRIDQKCSILNYWNDNRCLNPQLFELAEALMAVPSTQVSVERTFSQLKFVLSDQRCSMTSNILEDIMLIRCNKQFH